MSAKILLSDPTKIGKSKIKEKIHLYSGLVFDDLSKDQKDALLAVLLMERGYLTEDGVIVDFPELPEPL